MLVSTKDVRIMIQNSARTSNHTQDFQDGVAFEKHYLLTQISQFEKHRIQNAPELPYAESLTEEKALIVYCTPKLFEFVEKFEDVDDINLIMVGKLWLEVKKFLKEGKFKRV